jgi:hypothetical protein
MRTGRLGHLAEAKVQSFGQQHVQQPDAILAGNAGAQVCKGFGEADIVINFLQQIGDPNGGQAAIEIKHHAISIRRDCCRQTINLENAVLD